MRNVIVLVAIAGGAFALYNAWKASQEESSEARTIKALPPSVQVAVAQMDLQSQNAFFNEYELKKKKRSIAYVIWMVCGWHYLYTRQVGLQFAFWFTFGGLGVWWIADLFRMPGIVRGCNELIAREALQTLAMGNQFRYTAQQPGTAAPFGGTGMQITAEVAGTQASAAASPAAWHPDPHQRHELRYWDGTRWTEHVSSNGATSTDPMG